MNRISASCVTFKVRFLPKIIGGFIEKLGKYIVQAKSTCGYYSKDSQWHGAKTKFQIWLYKRSL